MSKDFGGIFMLKFSLFSGEKYHREILHLRFLKTVFLKIR